MLLFLDVSARYELYIGDYMGFVLSYSPLFPFNPLNPAYFPPSFLSFCSKLLIPGFITSERFLPTLGKIAG